ncbi:MAG: ATP synthase F1 subunit epsilon [Actinomycetota bacterium]
MATMQVAVVTPEREVHVVEDASFVLVRTLSGDMGILPGIAPQIAALGTGAVKIESGKQVRQMLVDGGFLIVKDNRCTILAEYAVLPEEVEASAVSERITELRAQRGSEDDRATRRELARNEALQALISS